jgi:glycosyltransferase involved in cell wall biosynthesis
VFKFGFGQDTEYSYQSVVVDNGSTDQTPSIVDQYNKYSNVILPFPWMFSNLLVLELNFSGIAFQRIRI